MVVYKSDIKRRYRDGSSCVESLPKRAKVHAQRKFAQGLNSGNLPEKPFVKEKEKVKPNGNSDPTPLLPADRPKTEDFLTFLCFRGTSVLPSRLDFFNVASGSDNCGSAMPSTSNQAPAEVTKVKNEKISGKHSAVKIHPNKYKEKARKAHTVASRMDVKRRSGRLARTAAIRRKKDIRLKKIRPQRVIVRRPINSAIHRRIADKKMRAGLRSGGRLPAGSDVGLSTFRRPRTDRSSSSQTISYPVRKSAIPLGDTSADDEEEDEEEDEVEEEEEEDDGDDDEENEKRNVKGSNVDAKDTKDDKYPRVRTRSSSLKSHPSPAHSLKRMPSRKTKEAAAAYMEMLSKSLRSPDVETDSYDEEEETQKIGKDAEKNKGISKRQVVPSKKAVPKKILPGRSLKDKSLKRVSTLNAQRKTVARNLKARHIEELSRKRTRSKAEAEKEVRPRRSRGRDKIKDESEMLEDEIDNEADKEEQVNANIEKKSSTKKEVHVKQTDNVFSSRRSRRSLKENVEESNKNKDVDSAKKQTRTSVKESSVDISQDSGVSRRSQTKVGNVKKDLENVKTQEAAAKSSPSRLRGRENANKKEINNEPEEMDVKDPPMGTLPRRVRKDAKAENNSRARGGTAKKEEETLTKASPSRGQKVSSPAQNSLKTANKKTHGEDIKKESEPLPLKSGNKRDIVAEVINRSEDKSSPVRSTRQSNPSEKNVTEESIKNTPKRKVDNESNVRLKRKSTAKDKGNVEKNKDTNENNGTDLNISNLEDETRIKVKRNSRNSSGTQIKDMDVELKIEMPKKRNAGKKQQSIDSSTVSDGDIRPKRSTRNKSDIIIDKDESSSEEEIKIKRNVKKQTSLTEENIKKRTSPPEENIKKRTSPPEENIKKQINLSEESSKKRTNLSEENIKKQSTVSDENIKKRTSLSEENIKKQANLSEENIKKRSSLPEENIKKRTSLPEETIKKRTNIPEENIKKQTNLSEENIKKRTVPPDLNTKKRTNQAEENIKKQTEGNIKKRTIPPEENIKKRANLPDETIKKQSNLSEENVKKQSNPSEENVKKQTYALEENIKKRTGLYEENIKKRTILLEEDVTKQNILSEENTKKQLNLPEENTKKQANLTEKNKKKQTNLLVENITKQTNLPEESSKKQTILPEDNKQKPQVKKKSLASPSPEEEEISATDKDVSTAKTKVGARKKNFNLSDEESISKNVPKKKLRGTIDNKSSSIQDNEVKAKVEPKKKNITKEQNETPLKDDKDLPRKKIDEKKNKLLDVDINSEIINKSEDTVLISKSNLNLKANSNSKDNFDSREGSLEKLDEKELKGFDEVNAKEMENKVDKFIEQMILKTSDDESKSKMRSKFKQAGGGVNPKEEHTKKKNVKSNNIKSRRESDKLKLKGQNGLASGSSMENVSSKPVANVSSDNSVSVPESQCSAVTVLNSSLQTQPMDSTLQGKRKSRVESKDKGILIEKNESDSHNICKMDDKKESNGKTHFTELKEESKLSGIIYESSGQANKVADIVNGCSNLKGSLEDNGAKASGNEIFPSRRTSVSSRISTDTTVSECKVVLETLDNLPGPAKSKQEIVKTKQPSKKNSDIKKVPEGPKPKAKATARIKRIEEQSPESESSDFEEELPKRESKLKAVKKKKKSAEVKPQPRRGMRELKALDTSQITLRTSRARVAKHSSSSFYYETESSSHFSSSEEDIPIKKIEVCNITRCASKVENITPQIIETKDPPKELPVLTTQVKTSDLVLEEKKMNDIPEDLIDFKSDFIRTDPLLMDPSLKDNRHLNQTEVLSPEDVRNIVKDIKASAPKISDLPSTSTSGSVDVKDVVLDVKKTISDNRVSFENRAMFEEARGSMELLASVAENVCTKMDSVPVEPIKPPMEKPQVVKPKPKQSSIGETWIQAFKRAKIPKPGQLSPISHSVRPFVRKPFINQPFSKQQSPVKCDPPDVNFKPFDRSSMKTQSSLVNTTQKPVGHPFKSSLPSSSSIPLVKPLTSDMKDVSGLKTAALNIPPLTISSSEIKKEQTIDNILNQQPTSKSMSPLKVHESFRPVDKVKEEPKCVIEARGLGTERSADLGRDMPGGKHHNLPLAVEHTLRKMSPVAVSRKPVASVSLKPQIQVPINQDIKEPNIFDKQSKSNRSSPSSGSKSSSWLWKPEKYLAESLVTKPSDLDLMAKKKVNMTMEEIEMWLNDSTSTGIEHSKDCGLFEKNQCECSFRTTGSSMQNSVTMLAEERNKVGRSIVQPPMQLKDIEPKCTAETISACKVEDYKEKLISKSSGCQFKDVKPDIRKDVSIKCKQPTPMKPDKAWKSTRSMTEEEMCEFDFRFERNSNSPRESGSEMSSPTPKDEMSSSNDEGIGSHHSERKSIFHKKNRPLSKSPCAFNAENESSVYAFEPESDLPVSKPFRRKNRLSGEESSRSTSIAVQVNLEPETVLECSTQTEQEEEDGGATFYIPLRRKSVEPQQMIQGVTVKLDADPVGQEHRVTLRAKLVTKPPSDFPRPPTTSRSLVGRSSGKSGKPEQKVRPLSMSDSKPPVGTVQPTLRPPADQPSTSQDSFPASTSSKSSQSTQFSTTPLKLSMDNKATSPLQSNSKSIPEFAEPSRAPSENNFPKVGMTPRIVEAPAFYPTEKEFLDPLEYLDKITPQAEHFGICRIVPPPSFKPECKVSDDMRFTSYNQYVHKMMRRWGPSVKEMTAIKKYLATQSIALTHPPWIGGMEVDLPRLYQTVQQCGGLKEVIEKKRWTRVADAMKIPKCAQDRVTKLDDIYCKYLLPYDTLSHNERCKLLEQVEHDWEEKERRVLLGESSNNSDESDSDSDDGMIECITKGRSMALSQFYRIARNTLWMWFGSEGGPPSSEDVEAEYWNQVTERTNHVCVHSGSIDCGTWGYGFPTAKTSSTSKHPWNLKVLTNHPASVLRSLPPLMGVTVPTLHVGMLFSTFCWYRDPHGLPWIEYLHTGANKIWYGVPDSWTNELRGAIKSVLPSIVRESPVWLPSDTAMLPPQLLLDKGVSLCRTVQEPGQFIVIFPKAYTSAICTGYLVSESVYYAPSSWLATAELLFKETKESCEPTMFSLEKLLFFIANDTRSPLDILIQVCPMVESVRNREVRDRKELRKLGLQSTEKLPKPSKRSSNTQQQEYECNNCRSYLFLSHVNNSNEDANYCLADALDMISKDASQLKHCKLLYLYDEEEMEELIEKIKCRIDLKSQKKNSKGNLSVGNCSKT